MLFFQKKVSLINCQLSIVNCRQRGSILLEAFIAIMVISIAFGALLEVGTLAIRTSTSLRKSTQAHFLLKESMEGVRSFRDGSTWASGLGSLNTGQLNPYHITQDTTVTPYAWKMISGTETLGIFTRKIVIDKVSRDTASYNIETTYNSAHDDANTRKITVTVSWENKTLSLATYLTHWR